MEPARMSENCRGELVPLEDETRTPDSPEEEEDLDTQCGTGSCRPRALQAFANVNAFTGFYSIAGLLSTTLIAYVSSQVTTLERQFGLSSSETGMVVAGNDMGYLVTALFVGFFAHRVHIPRVLSVLVAVFGVSGIICALPHFLFGAAPMSETVNSLNETNTRSRFPSEQLCTFNSSMVDVCEKGPDSSSFGLASVRPRDNTLAALVIIMTGMFFQGMAKAPGYPLSVTYLDNTRQRTNTGFYMGIIVSLKIFGPAIAFGLGGYFTRIYVTLEDTDLSVRHPRWIGAWWLGYLVFGIIAIIVSVPVFFFPRRFRDAPTQDESKTTHTLRSNVLHQIIKELKDYLRVVCALLYNPVNVCIVLASVCLTFSTGGSYSFMPKYLENQFGIPAWKSNILLAGVGTLTATFGTFLGGWLTRHFKMTAITALRFVSIILCTKIILTCLGFVFGCPQPVILSQPSSDDVEIAGRIPCVTSECNCDTDFFPICGSDGNTFFSPCRAGCQQQDGRTYTNCTCIPDGGHARAGECGSSCNYLYPYVINLAVTSFFSTLLIMPMVVVKIRCVREEEKPMALAFSSWCSSLFGWLLGPIIYGFAIDTACLIWNTSSGQRGACAVYDLRDFRVKLHVFDIASSSAGLLVLTIAMLIAAKCKRHRSFLSADGRKEPCSNSPI